MRRPEIARRLGRGNRGTTLIEIMIVLTVMVVAAGLFSRMVIATTELRHVNRENGIAAEAARVALEQMRDNPFGSIYALYNGDPNDDPGGVGTAPGARFAVAGLEPRAGSPDGLQLTVVMPSLPPGTPSQIEEAPAPPPAPTGGGVLGGGSASGGPQTGGTPPPSPATWELREDFLDDALGLPRDLNGDSIIDAADHAEDYILLPVRIRVEWQGLRGDRSYEIHAMLTDFLKP